MTSDATARRQLELAIEAQEALRGVVPDEIVDAAVAALRQRLAESSSDRERRRQVTVLFADVSGFTEMSSRVDPEEVARVINQLWAELDVVVVEHGGRVDKHIGDALMAVWGMEITAEDDPERAVRAALAMQSAVRRGSADHGLVMRAGINTGPVHVGAVGASSEVTVIGDTVNVASRVEQLAPAGGVLTTHETYRHIRGVFDVEGLEPVRVKGKVDPIRVYLVHRAKERRFQMPTRGVEGVETRTVGRERELEVLQSEFTTVIDEARPRRVTIIGDAGIGKSRVLYELENWIELHLVSTFFFKGRATAMRRSVASGLLRDLLADRFRVLDDDPTPIVATKLRRGFHPILTADEADVVGHWLGFELRSSAAVQRLLGSAQLASAARAHLLRYIAALAATSPVAMFLEDLHWADEESLGFFDDLVEHASESHLLVVGVGRPALLERPEMSGLLERSSQVLVLEPLDTRAARELVAEVLQQATSVPAELVDLIVDRADGNAYYVEELTKMLIDEGVIETGSSGDPWKIHVDRLQSEHVPATLTGVLQARLDGLPSSDRDALQRASVVGRIFWDDAVRSLGREEIAATSGALATASRRELVLRHDPSSFGDTLEYVFKHALLRDVTYETVLLRDRRRLHGVVARWMSDHARGRASEYSSQIALHLRLAGELSAAAVLLHQAATTALDAGNSPAARRHLTDAFVLWAESGDAPPTDAFLAMGEASLRLGELDDAAVHVDAVLERVTAPPERCRAHFLSSWIASERGDRERERAMLDLAMPDAERVGGTLLVRVLSGLAWWEVVRGDLAAASTHAERARVLAVQLRHPIASREALGLLGAIASTAGDLQTALRLSEEALAVATGAGDLEGQALAQSNIGVCRHLIGDTTGSADEYRSALMHYLEARDLNRRLGRRLQDAMAVGNIAQLQIRLGDDDAARSLLREALNIVRGTGSIGTILFCVMAEADRRLTRGDITRAVELLGRVHDHPATTEDNHQEIVRILARARLGMEALPPAGASGAAHDLGALIDQLARDLDADENTAPPAPG